MFANYEKLHFLNRIKNVYVCFIGQFEMISKELCRIFVMQNYCINLFFVEKSKNANKNEKLWNRAFIEVVTVCHNPSNI